MDQKNEDSTKNNPGEADLNDVQVEDLGEEADHIENNELDDFKLDYNQRPTAQSNADVMRLPHLDNNSQNPNSAPGSFISQDLNNYPDEINIDQEYRSNGSAEGGDINIDFNQIAAKPQQSPKDENEQNPEAEKLVENLDLPKEKVIVPVLSPIQENPLAEGFSDIEGENRSIFTSSEQNEDQKMEKRRDPEEEFFMLSVLALKMTHTEEHDAEYIYEIHAQKLFNQVK